MTDYYQGVLFPDFYPQHSKSTISPYDCSVKIRKRELLNLHWYSEFPTEGDVDMPLVSSYNGTLPESFISFSDRNDHAYSCGIHCFLYDYKIEPTWHNPSRVISCLKEYSCVIGPDFSLFVDMPHALNVWNVYRNRWVTSYWQSHSIKTIPSASWGNVESFRYCFDGLPEQSIIAIGHTSIGKDKSSKMLYRLGVQNLIERKHPTKLLVYGAPLDFVPDVEVMYYEGVIQKLRKL